MGILVLRELRSQKEIALNVDHIMVVDVEEDITTIYLAHEMAPVHTSASFDDVVRALSAYHPFLKIS